MKNHQLQISRQLDKGLEEPDIDQEEEPDNVQEKEPDNKRRRLEAVTLGDHKYHVEHVTRRERVEKSLKAVMKNMICEETPFVSQLCSREVAKAMIEDLAKTFTKKMQRRIKKNEAKHFRQTSRGVDVAEAYSAPIMTQMAQQPGYREGFALDLTVDDEHGKGWDLSIKEVLERTLTLGDIFLSQDIFSKLREADEAADEANAEDSEFTEPALLQRP